MWDLSTGGRTERVCADLCVVVGLDGRLIGVDVLCRAGGSGVQERHTGAARSLFFHGTVHPSIHPSVHQEKCHPSPLRLSCSVDDFCCFSNLISTHDSLVKPAHFFFNQWKTELPKLLFLVYRFGFQVAASRARYGSLHQWPCIRDLLQVLFPFLSSSI